MIADLDGELGVGTAPVGDLLLAVLLVIEGDVAGQVSHQVGERTTRSDWRKLGGVSDEDQSGDVGREGAQNGKEGLLGEHGALVNDNGSVSVVGPGLQDDWLLGRGVVRALRQEVLGDGLYRASFGYVPCQPDAGLPGRGEEEDRTP